MLGFDYETQAEGKKKPSPKGPLLTDETDYREALGLLDDPSVSDQEKETLLSEVQRWNASNPELATKINQEGFSKPTDEARATNAKNRQVLTQMAAGGLPADQGTMAALSSEVQKFEQQFPERADLGMGRFQVTPNAEHQLGDDPAITAARQAQLAEEAEQTKQQGPPINSKLETLSQVDDPRFVRPPEYTNRGDASYSIWDIVPAVMGGRAEAWHEPTVDEFRTAKRAELGDSVDTMDERSDPYKRYADEQWVREYENAKRDKRPVFRQSIKARKLQGSGVWGALPTNVFSELARDPAGTARTVGEELLGASTAAASKFDDTALLGAGKAATRMLGGDKAAAEAEKAAERSDVGSAIGAVGGVFTPEAPANLAAATVYRGAKKLFPNMGVLGRTAAGAAGGATGALVDVEGSAAIREASGGGQTETDPALAALIGGALGGGLHGVGEFAGSRWARRRDPTISPTASVWTQADEAQVRPGLTGGIKPPKRAEAILREATATGRDPVEVQAERMMPGMKSAALQKELAHEASPTVTELEEFFNSPEGMKRVNAQRVVDVARKELRILKESAAYASKPRDVEALSGFISDLERSARSGGGPATLNAREVQDAIDGMEARFTPEMGFTSKRANSIMQELYRDLFAVRDQFRGAPLDTLAVRLGPPAGTIETPGGKLDARQQVTGLSALMHKRAKEHEAMEGFRDVAGLPPRRSDQPVKAQPQIVGKEEGPPGLQMSSAQHADFKREIMRVREMDVKTPQRREAIRELASMAGLDKELDNIAAIVAGENLKRLLQPGNTPLYVGPGGLGLGSVGTVQRLGARLDPAQKALAEEFSPKLLEFLADLRKTGPVRPPLGSPMQPFALRGGAAGARAANLLTDEDIGNLQALIRERQAQQ